jgi:hypothetical protein
LRFTLRERDDVAFAGCVQGDRADPGRLHAAIAAGGISVLALPNHRVPLVRLHDAIAAPAVANGPPEVDGEGLSARVDHDRSADDHVVEGSILTEEQRAVAHLDGRSCASVRKDGMIVDHMVRGRPVVDVERSRLRGVVVDRRDSAAGPRSHTRRTSS